MSDQTTDKIIIDDTEIWCDYAIRFVAGLYGLVSYYWKNDDKYIISEIIAQFTALIDGLSPDTRSFIQPSFGFVVSPDEHYSSNIEKNIPPTIVLPLYGISTLTEFVGAIVNALHENPIFEDVQYSRLSDEKFLELKQICKSIL